VPAPQGQAPLDFTQADGQPARPPDSIAADSFEVSGWRLHCDAWEQFLERRAEFDSYADFLARREP